MDLLSPTRHGSASPFNDLTDSNLQQTFGCALESLNRFGPAYVHVVETSTADRRPPLDFPGLRQAFHGAYIANSGYTRERASAALAARTGAPQ